jgi:predicted nucleic acid-binding protein
MIVVSDTSPLTNLAAIGQFALLYHLYGRLHIAEGVWEELNARSQHWPGRDETAAADWIERHTVQNATQRLELRVNGVVGLLLEAKSLGALVAVRPHLDALRHSAGFYLGEPVYHAALSLAGESEP